VHHPQRGAVACWPGWQYPPWQSEYNRVSLKHPPVSSDEYPEGKPRLMNDRELTRLCDPEALALKDAVQLAKQIAVTEPLLDVHLARKLPGRESSKPLEGPFAVRALEILDAISKGGRLLSAVVQLIGHPDPRLRSKAASFIGRRTQNVKWAEKYLLEPDQRVRANVIEAMWGLDHPGTREILTQARVDGSNRVAGNALIGLHALKHPEVFHWILEMAKHPSPLFRVTAAWVMGKTADPAFQEPLKEMFKDKDPKVKSMVVKSLVKLKKAAT